MVIKTKNHSVFLLSGFIFFQDHLPKATSHYHLRELSGLAITLNRWLGVMAAGKNDVGGIMELELVLGQS
ncbi:MAG: hypothetical protein A2921_04555 [Candidatus Magasanikbacteria bacterium RIFCSPLOWO2_01_FULL_43_20b]|uniref:Uncharacterized protein n=1 Tax=Candidatus Magasanikbacteria bacterium RIFCSPLOWO2_12_FULL_43_12 TaxID=1798692 RepID=A0A1F6MR58_9BACT|nr:MAG: hypothetical protein A3C74_02600 [Candidatus Magasanikbacteria bacterium RIFCSPHIGHO2_02_FULL_44_13]OGH72600.1 MAG: hypothetical protein A3I93_01565 [Candidatus Magasanikbacteria bacterium RIFCSPLOWO2_02_FULL_43_22]OGH73338.1 MAG: hypothetical protein A2921_04555 [Candidatus Magasanikbacteria bacterium RIFCSPLOWO2_01_FULL_43_20b]OGH74149.1 MAG: hypothetical protein A3G00_02890 [Candidatus Magasanikbacteria bacterium RIFCSPLOWO2_12_FULL_43_12]